MRIEVPIVWRFTKPKERVLFNRARRANPFFHLFEAMWMLDGRDDLKSIQHYNQRMAEYSDDGETINDAYGYRWRTWFDVDQLSMLASLLINQPDTRRAVLGMWDVDKDLPQVVYKPECKAVPCNTHCYFDIVDQHLNLTVCNRSNDAIWGAFGANAVHFSFLLEYMAIKTGNKVGHQTHFSTNLHVYDWMIDRVKRWLRDETLDYYLMGPMHTVPLIGANELVTEFEDDLHAFIDDPTSVRQTRFLDATVRPMMIAWDAHKRRDYDAAFNIIGEVESEDWKIAGLHWLLRTHQIWQEDDK